MSKPNVYFTWDIHYECNYNCTYCYLNHEHETKAIKPAAGSADKLTGIWKDIFMKYGKAHIFVTGGEPFTFPGFMDMISELSKYHTFEFSTNLSWDVKTFAAKINSNPIVINPSFHPEYASQDEFIEKCEELRRSGYLVGFITMVAYPPFLEQLGRYKEFFQKRGFESVIYPYRGPYSGNMYPESYSKAERERLLGLGISRIEMSEEVNRGLTQKYNICEDSPPPQERTVPADDLTGMPDMSGSSASAGTVPSDTEVQNNKSGCGAEATGGTDGNNPEAGDGGQYCLMGMKYAKILPNGDAFRCCAAVWTPSKDWKNWGSLGNIYDGSFRFYDEPKICTAITAGDCKCYKAMIAGKESSWSKYWKGPSDRETVLKIALLKKRGKTAEAISLCESFDTEDTYYPDVLFIWGEMLMADNSEKAFQKVTEALKYQPGNAHGMRLLKKLYASRGQAELANSIKDDPLETKLENIRRLIDQKRFNEAAALCDEFRPYDEFFLDTLVMRGEALLSVNAETAKKTILSALEMDPENGWALRTLGKVHIELKEYDEAKKALAKSIEYEKGQNKSWSYLVLAKMYKQLGDDTSAFENFKKAYEHNPEHLDIIYEFGEAGGFRNTTASK